MLTEKRNIEYPSTMPPKCEKGYHYLPERKYKSKSGDVVQLSAGCVKKRSPRSAPSAAPRQPSPPRAPSPRKSPKCEKGFHYKPDREYKSRSGDLVQLKAGCVKMRSPRAAPRQPSPARQPSPPRARSKSPECPPGQHYMRKRTRTLSTGEKRTYPAGCVKDKSPRSKTGSLTQYGYSTKDQVPERNAALEKAVKAMGASSVYRKLKKSARLLANKNPEAAELLDEDAEYVFELFPGLNPGNVAEPFNPRATPLM